ncbi:MAG: hypothetical protein WCA94_19495, partial [Candidatus Acidiferrum sp.]
VLRRTQYPCPASNISALHWKIAQEKYYQIPPLGFRQQSDVSDDAVGFCAFRLGLGGKFAAQESPESAG